MTCLILEAMTTHILVARFAEKDHPLCGQRITMGRIPLSPSEHIYPYTLIRNQFPVRLAFAATINKCQGQTLDFIGVFLPTPVFSHGQLYVALSRVGDPRNIAIYIDKTGITDHCVTNAGTAFTRNVVFL